MTDAPPPEHQPGTGIETGTGPGDAGWRSLNRAWWDERTPLHVASSLYDVEGFRRGRDTVEAFEVELFGDVTGLRLAHLQCHFGLDTMSWARNHGATAVGLDFSAPAVETANGLAVELGIDARFVCADVYDAVDALNGEQFDVVYTGLGALNWLPDLSAWASVVSGLVRPGGRLLLSEFHPFSWVFDNNRDGRDLAVAYDYFGAEPFLDEHEGSYADLTAHTVHNQTVEHQHPVAAVLRVLLAAGLGLEAYEEYDFTLFPQFPLMERHGRHWRLPATMPRIPLMFALVARAPG